MRSSWKSSKWCQLWRGEGEAVVFSFFFFALLFSSWVIFFIFPLSFSLSLLSFSHTLSLGLSQRNMMSYRRKRRLGGGGDFFPCCKRVNRSREGRRIKGKVIRRHMEGPTGVNNHTHSGAMHHKNGRNERPAHAKRARGEPLGYEGGRPRWSERILLLKTPFCQEKENYSRICTLCVGGGVSMVVPPLFSS